MQSRIFKYPLEVESRQLVYMPTGAKILFAGEQNERPVLWAMIDVDSDGKALFDPEPRVIRVVTTGEEFNPADCTFIGTVTLGGWFVAHIFEQENTSSEGDVVSARFRGDFIQIQKDTINDRK